MVIYEKIERVLRIPRGAVKDIVREKCCPDYERGYDDGYAAGYEAAQAKSVNLTQAEYDNLEEKDCSVFYCIVDE